METLTILLAICVSGTYREQVDCEYFGPVMQRFWYHIGQTDEQTEWSVIWEAMTT